MRVWRVTDAQYADAALSGLGAEKYGGRYNSPGRKVIYAAGSLSLAMLEILVQANNRSRLRSHVALWIDVREEDIVHLAASELPRNWNALPYRSSTQELGDRSLDRGDSLVLGVPSVVVPVEWNYLINPDHPRFGSLEFGVPCAAGFDPRFTE